MRAVVTGGAGFLGSHLCDRLIAEGWDVLALDNLVTGADSSVAHLIKHPKFRITRADVSNYIDVAGPVDYVLHFASPASPVDYLKLPIPTLSFSWPRRANAMATRKFHRSTRNTGGMSIRSARAAFTMKRSVSPKR